MTLNECSGICWRWRCGRYSAMQYTSCVRRDSHETCVDAIKVTQSETSIDATTTKSESRIAFTLAMPRPSTSLPPMSDCRLQMHSMSSGHIVFIQSKIPHVYMFSKGHSRTLQFISLNWPPRQWVKPLMNSYKRNIWCVKLDKKETKSKFRSHIRYERYLRAKEELACSVFLLWTTANGNAWKGVI